MTAPFTQGSFFYSFPVKIPKIYGTLLLTKRVLYGRIYLAKFECILSSCVSIRTRFGCVFLRHCIVKILANASALAPFLPRIVAKTQHRKFFEPKQDKIDCFSRRQVAGILTYFKTDNVEIRLFYLILASSDTDATA